MDYVLLLGILLICGLFSTRIMKKLNLPNVTGYLLVGLIIAIICIIFDTILGNTKSVFDPLTSTFKGGTLEEELVLLNNLISGIALGFIALTIGEEFRWSKIKKVGSKIITITFFQAFLTAILVDIALIILCLSLKLPLEISICLGAIATATAPAATLMIINQYKAKGKLVDILLPVVAFDDAIGLIIFSISLSIAKVIASGTTITIMSIIIIPLINILGSIILGALLGFLLHFVVNYFKSRNNHIVTLIAFTLLGVGLCSSINKIQILGESLEFSNLLCCMMIGALYNNLASEEHLDIVKRDFELVERWTPFLFMLFFILSGTHLVTSIKMILEENINTLLIAVMIFIVYLIVRCIGKYFGAYFGCKVSHQDKITSTYLGIMLFPQAGVAIGMANQVSQIECFKLTDSGNIIVTVVLCATLIYELFGPLLTKWALIKSGQIVNQSENNNDLNLQNNDEINLQNVNSINQTQTNK